jgi:hypothetical protein
VATAFAPAPAAWLIIRPALASFCEADKQFSAHFAFSIGKTEDG